MEEIKKLKDQARWTLEYHKERIERIKKCLVDGMRIAEALEVIPLSPTVTVIPPITFTYKLKSEEEARKVVGEILKVVDGQGFEKDLMDRYTNEPIWCWTMKVSEDVSIQVSPAPPGCNLRPIPVSITFWACQKE